MAMNLRKIKRVDILRKAKSSTYRKTGLCSAIRCALEYYGLSSLSWIDDLSEVFPLFTRGNAKRFGADLILVYWWPIGEWNTGRMDFLNWLIEQYKDDNTDLRKLQII